MSSEQTQPTQPATPFAALAGEPFAVLTTYRRSGVAVPTTVWFAPAVEDASRLYITTSRATGKYKRIHNNPQVTLTPSDAMGNTHGETIAAHAAAAPADEFARAEAALAAKYGDQFRGMLARNPDNGDRVYIKVTPAS